MEKKKSKKTLLIIMLLTAIFAIGGFVFYKFHKSPEHHKRIAYVENEAKTVEDLTEEEKQIFGKEDKKTKLEKEVEKNYSEEYKKYEKLSEEEKKKIDIVPRKEDIPITVIDDINNNEEKITNIPKSYNLKDHIKIKVEDQQSYGLCWDFASMKSLETNLLLKEGKDLDLSELHLDYYQSELMYGFRQIHDAGSFGEFTNYALITGAVLEDDVPYITTLDNPDGPNYKLNDFKEEEYSKFTSLNQVVHVTDVVDFPSIRKSNGDILNDDITDEKLNEFRNVIKKHIMKNGSIYTVIKSTTDKNIYCNDDCWSDHAVSIVGWDDDYSKENFTSVDGSHPKHDGAYIMLNSWGEWYGDKGYFYVSYDDALVETQMSGVLSTSMDDTIKIDSIQNQVVKDIIYDQLKYNIINYNNSEYISKIALRKVVTIDLKDKNLTSNDLDEFEIFSNLFAIDLSNNNITDIEKLTKIKNINSIYLNNNNVTDVSVLKDLANLESLHLSGNKNVSGYEKLSNLRVLNLSNTDLVTLKDLSNYNKLYELNLSNNPHLDYNTVKLPNNLSVLSLDNTGFTGYDFSNNKSLFSISIKNNNLKNLNVLKNIKITSSLDVSNNEITDFSAVKNVFDTDNIECEFYDCASIIAQENKITDISIINDLNVEAIDLSKNNITDISNFDNKKIKMIDLSNNNIEKGFETLNNALTINLNNCNISSFDGFSNLNNTYTINLNNNNITNFKGLGALKNLEFLSLANNKINDLSGISKLENLSNLDLSNNDISDITPLNSIKSLSTLSLSGNKKIKGKLDNDIYLLNIKDCELNKDFDLSGLKNLLFINLSNNRDMDIENIIKETMSDNITIEADDLNITEEQFLKIDKLNSKDKKWHISGATMNVNMTVDDNNIDLMDKYYIRKMLMQQLNSGITIDNGTINNKVEYIHIIDPDNKKVSFKSHMYHDYYSDISVNITY